MEVVCDSVGMDGGESRSAAVETDPDSTMATGPGRSVVHAGRPVL